MTLSITVPFWGASGEEIPLDVVFKYYITDGADTFYKRALSWVDADIALGELQNSGFFYAQDALPETGTLTEPPASSLRII